MKSSLSQLFENSQKRIYPNNQILIFQGDKIKAVSLIKAGLVKIYDIDSKGNNKVLLILRQGNLLPITLNRNQTARFFYSAIGDTELCNMSLDEFLVKTKIGSGYCQEIRQYQNHLLNDLLARIECIDGSDALHKVVKVFQYLQTHHGTLKDNLVELNLPLNHQLIADLGGITRETASAQIKDLELKNVIKISQRSKYLFCPKKAERLGLI